MVSAATAMKPDRVPRALVAGDLLAIGSDEAAALRLLNDPRLLEWLGTMQGVSLVGLRSGMRNVSSLVIVFSCPGGNLTIALPTEMMPALTMAAGAGGHTVLSIVPMIAARLLAPMLEKIGRAAKAVGDKRWHAIGVASVRVAAAGLDRLQAPLALWEITRESEFQTQLAVLAIDPGCVVALQDLVDRQSVRRAPASRHWRVPTLIRLGTRRWQVALLDSLEAGDVMLCKENLAAATVDAQLFCGASAGRHWTADVQINQRKVIVMNKIQTHQGSDFDSDSLEPPLSSEIATLEVPVHFEVDNAALSLAELSALQPGYVIELSIPIEEAEIRLVSCGQIIARGRMVVIAGCLGVQIERLGTGSA